MIHIHPHWESTDDPLLRENSSSLPEKVKIVVGTETLSRLPAALVGILAAVAIGLLLFHQMHRLSAQVSSSETMEIRITSGGISPASVAVVPGVSVTWLNEQDKPHILSSDTLKTTDGPLYSTAIFPQERYTATLSLDLETGEYSYVSLTDPDISGVLRVEKAGLPSPSPIPPAPEESPSSPPRNPYALGGSPSTESPSAPGGPLQGTVISPLQKPFHQPETGFPEWLVALMSIGTLLFLSKRILGFSRPSLR